jgi:glycosyltransferase involved in cell wall biosynthesis
MTNPDRNAAIWYADDAYHPEEKGINGRRIAGASFLQGFLAHADVSEFVSLTTNAKSAKTFADAVVRHSRDIMVRGVLESTAVKLAPVGTVYYPSPNYAELLWKRQAFGMEAYSICGITHTTATQGVMRGMYDLRAGPQAQWDGLICTSRAVHAATLRNLDIVDEVLMKRFGSLPPRPQMPVIPLGINCDDFSHDAKAANALRTRHGWTDDDIAVVTLSRLLPFGKFDPGPLFVSLQRAQEALGKTKRLHFIACGIYGNEHSRAVFEDCAKLLMPDVSFIHMDGASAAARKEILSGGDIFTFPIDNIQETFGLAPIEAMAAGLPLVVSDWDGMRDTVTPDVGFIIPTRTVQAEASKPESHGYLMGTLSYAQYGARLSCLTSIDVAKMADAFVELASNADLRQRMGHAAEQRARRLYDWVNIIPVMQDFWGELAQIKRANTTRSTRANPVAPLPFDLFASYPSKVPSKLTEGFVATGTKEQLYEIYTARRLEMIGNPFEAYKTLEQVFSRLFSISGANIATLAFDLKYNPLTIERAVMFLLKYGLIELKP